MAKSKKSTLDAFALAALVVLFVALIMLSNVLLRGVRLDLTENKLYSVSEGTRKILADIAEPINLYFFYSERAVRDVPYLRAYANRVREVLEEFALYADGKIKLKVINPLPFSEDEDLANQYGLQAIQLGGLGSDPLYFGVAGTNSVDDIALIPFFQVDKEVFLEYDLAKLVYTLANPQRPVIGLMSWLPMQGAFDPATSQFRQSWVLTEQLEQLFEIRTVNQNTNAIEDDIDVLMIVHPKNISEATEYAIDQFILGGGKAVVLVDPYSEADQPAPDPNNPYGAALADRSSDLPRLFEAWGVDYDHSSVVLDRALALGVTTPGGGTVRHYGFVRFDADTMDRADVVTSTLDEINTAIIGFFRAREGATTVLETLIESSDEAMTVAADRFRFLPDPGELRQGFAPTGERYVFGARLTGKVASAFPDGPPGGEPSSEEQTGTHLDESADDVNLILLADTDLLTDRFWVRAQNFFGQRLISAFANNGDLMANSLDSLTGSNELISIRARASFSRPFKRVEALEREAEERFLATEDRLERELEETERKLTELQASREDGDALILSAEQRTELERFREERIRIRKELRDVRRDLDKSKERLGTTLKIINIGLVPLVISLFALAAVLIRSRERRVIERRAK